MTTIASPGMVIYVAFRSEPGSISPSGVHLLGAWITEGEAEGYHHAHPGTDYDAVVLNGVRLRRDATPIRGSAFGREEEPSPT